MIELKFLGRIPTMLITAFKSFFSQPALRYESCSINRWRCANALCTIGLLDYYLDSKEFTGSGRMKAYLDGL